MDIPIVLFKFQGFSNLNYGVQEPCVISLALPVVDCQQNRKVPVPEVGSSSVA